MQISQSHARQKLGLGLGELHNRCSDEGLGDRSTSDWRGWLATIPGDLINRSLKLFMFTQLATFINF